MASLRARHSRKCSLNGAETPAPRSEKEKIPGCTCKPTYSIRGAAGQSHERVGRDLRAAVRALTKHQAALDAGEPIPQENIRFAAWADRWLASLERNPVTIKGYDYTMRYAKQAFGHVLVRKITPAHVQQMLDLTKQAGHADSTRAKHLRGLNACLNSAISHGYTTHNPITRIPKGERPRAGRREAPYFENGELPKLFKHLPEGLWRTLFTVALKTGMREGELAALQWGDIDFGAEVIRVRRNYSNGHLGDPKSHEKRTVDITEDVVTMLGKWWGEAGNPADDRLVFPNLPQESYIPYWRFTRVLYAAMKAAGVPRVGPTGGERVFHSLRHTNAKVALENGLSVFWLSRQLGHSTVKVTTDIYGHWERATAKVEAAKMEGVFGV